MLSGLEILTVGWILGGNRNRLGGLISVSARNGMQNTWFVVVVCKQGTANFLVSRGPALGPDHWRYEI